MRQLWIASGNAKKRVELERLLSGLGYQVRLMSEAGEEIEIVEDAPDFAGNAAKKAATLARVVGAWAIGDDSGLCVDALEGRPGVLSARYAGPGASDDDRIAKLLDELGDRPDRERVARFVCCACIADADGRILASFQESCEGIIRSEKKGSGGFGYDPVFVPDQHRADDTTFAQLSPEEKDAISHRGQAMRRLAAWLQENRP